MAWVRTQVAGAMMDNTQEILSELKKIIKLLEEQNDIMLLDDVAEDRISCCSECDGTCDKE